MRSVLVAGLLVVGLFGSAAHADEAYGIELVPWSKPIGTDRWRSGRDYDATIKHFRKKVGRSVRWHPEVNLPTVKYIHVQNTEPIDKRTWDGINIYTIDRRVEFYILRHDPKAAAATARVRSDDDVPGPAPVTQQPAPAPTPPPAAPKPAGP